MIHRDYANRPKCHSYAAVLLLVIVLTITIHAGEMTTLHNLGRYDSLMLPPHGGALDHPRRIARICLFTKKEKKAYTHNSPAVPTYCISVAIIIIHLFI